MTRVAFIGNQGGFEVIAFYAGMARSLVNAYGVTPRFSVWLERETKGPADFGVPAPEVYCFERYVRTIPAPNEEAVDRLVRGYSEVNWSEVVAAERAFTDYSMLLGSAGERDESPKYIRELVVSCVRYLESVLAGCQAMVCQTADTLFSLIAFKVAHHLGVPPFAIAPAWLLEPGKGGGFFANSEYLECRNMMNAFARRQGKMPTGAERARADALIRSIREYDGKTAYLATTSKGMASGRNALSPNYSRMLGYLRENARRDRHVEYNKVDPIKKLRANVLRLTRKFATRNKYGSLNPDVIPPGSVFYAIHYQPEQSTLAQGIWHVNQVALVENISKSLPLGYTLVVKEHPWGRGNRPLWQYEHMTRLPNVIFCDAPAKQIIQRVDAVIAVSGTVAMESLVFDKPTVMLGRNFFEFSDLLYRVNNAADLPKTLYRILIEGDHRRQPDRENRLRQFLLAYLDGLVPYFPMKQYAEQWGLALARELRLTVKQS